MFKRILAVLICAAAIAVSIFASPANAARSTHDTTVGPDGSYQTAITNRENGGEIRLVNHAAVTMSGSHCIDVSVDWNTGGTGHYDIRTLRNCQPGGTVQTDPAGNGYWQEGWPNNCCPVTTNNWPVTGLGDPVRTITGIQTGGAYMISDTYQNGNFAIAGPVEMWQSTPANTPPPIRARTQGDLFAHVRTLYDNGSVDTTSPYQVGPCEAFASCNYTQTWAGRSVSKSGRLAEDADYQAANVVIAYKENGEYSECMAAQGYDVPWEWSIHLDPSISTPALEEQEQNLQDHLSADGGVISSDAFLQASWACRKENVPADDGQIASVVANAHDAVVLDQARDLGWSSDDPFAD